MGDGQVENAVQVVQTSGSQMLQVKDREPVWSGGSRVSAAVDNGCGVIWGERGEIVVERMVSLYLTESTAEVWVAGVGDGVCELFVEGLGNCSVFCAGLYTAVWGRKRDRLVGGDFRSFPGETPDCTPESLNIRAVGNGGDEGPPLGAGVGSGLGVYFSVQCANGGVCRVPGSEGITLCYEALNLRAGSRGEVPAVARGNGGLSCVKEDTIELPDGSVGGCRLREAAELGLRDGGEGRPVGPLEISVRAAGSGGGGVVKEGDCDR